MFHAPLLLHVNMDPSEILALITCPVCMELCEAPIFQCAQGHILCSFCKVTLEAQRPQWQSLAQCPICRDYSMWSRNTSVEQMAAKLLKTHMYACPNNCDTILTYGQGMEHLAACRQHGVACLHFSCEKRVSRAAMAQHVAASHSDIRSLVWEIGEESKSLANLAPTEFVSFIPKGSPTGHYILHVHHRYDAQNPVATWILVKRHRKSHIEIGMECLYASEGFRNLAYVLSASDSNGTSAVMTFTSTTQRIRDEGKKGIVLKETPSYAMQTFQVDVKHHASIHLRVRFPENDGTARKRARIDISSDDDDNDMED